MNLVKSYCISKYFGEFDSTSLLKETQKHIDPSVTKLSKEFQFIFHKILYTDPCSYWNKDVYNQTSSLLKSLFQNYGNQIEIDESIFNYFLMGYNSYCQLSEIILDLRNFNLTQEIRTRLYRLPTYTALLESCLSNFLRVIATLTGKGVGKDYSMQNTLGQLINVINSNGYQISSRLQYLWSSYSGDDIEIKNFFLDNIEYLKEFILNYVKANIHCVIRNNLQ